MRYMEVKRGEDEKKLGLSESRVVMANVYPFFLFLLPHPVVAGHQTGKLFTSWLSMYMYFTISPFLTTLLTTGL
jgi:hypothetical protein